MELHIIHDEPDIRGMTEFMLTFLPCESVIYPCHSSRRAGQQGQLPLRYGRGGDDFIAKPFDEEQLAARLRVAERIRSPISAEPVSSHSGIIPATVSVGVMIVAIALARMEPRLLRPRTWHSTG
ncbi:MAG: hypothetical protein ABJA60_01210 [Nitrosospira sp.]